MAGEDVDGLQLVGAGVDDVEEAERLLDAAGNLRVLFLQDGIADVAQAPVKWTVQVSNARGNG